MSRHVAGQLPPEPEAVLQSKVVQLLELAGYAVYHTYDSRRSAAGLPDIIAIKDRRGLAIELKSERGVLKAAQREWLRLFNGCRFDAYVFKPSDWAEIVRVVHP